MWLSVSGLRCTGKTTLGDYLADNHGFSHIEASDFMRSILKERSVPFAEIDEFALTILQKDPCAIPRSICEKYAEEHNVVVTGFRSPFEVHCTRQLLGKWKRLEVVYIEAETKLRLARCNVRGRGGSANLTLAELEEQDNIHLRMGVHEIAELSNVVKIDNNGELEDFRRRIEFLSNHLKGT